MSASIDHLLGVLAMALAIDAGATDEPLIEMTIGELLARTVAEHGDREALIVPHQGVRLTWSEFDAVIDQVAKGLMAYGVEVGDRVGMWSPNYAEWVYVQFATAKIGAIQVNVNPSYRTSELEYALNQSGAKILICLLYTSPSPRDATLSRMPSSA